MLLPLVALLILGLMSLSSVGMRGERQGRDRAIAQANARLALMLAVGELQRTTGPDTRVTGPADIAGGPGRPRQLLGAWRSWEGEDRDPQTGMPAFRSGTSEPPNYSSKLRNAGGSGNGGRFLGWLVSGDSARDFLSVPDLSAASSKVPLLSSGSLGPGKESSEVHVTPTTAPGGQAAWWVSGENMKALMRPPEDRPGSVEVCESRLASYGRCEPGVFGVVDSANLGKVVSHGTFRFVRTSPADGLRPDFLDMTPHAVGLLTNTATGGWRKDLSLMTENWDALPPTGLPFLTTRPGFVTSASKADGVNRPPSFLIYPWSEVRRSPQSAPQDQLNAVTSWTALRDWATQYKRITSGGGDGRVVMPAQGTGSGWGLNPDKNFTLTTIRDTATRFPLMARLHWVFSYSAKVNPDGQQDADSNNDFIACIVASPVVTFWNPFDVTLSVTDLYVEDEQMAPVRFEVSVGSRDQPPRRNLAAHSLSRLRGISETQNQGVTFLRCRSEDGTPTGGGNLVFQPGETKIFSIREAGRVTDQAVGGNNHVSLHLFPGYRTQSGFRFELRDPDRSYELVTGSATEVFKAGVSFDAGNITDQQGDIGAFLFVRARTPQNNFHVVQEVRNGFSRQDAARFWPRQEVINTNKTLGVLLDTTSPFCASLFGPKTTNRGTFVAKGALHHDPRTTHNQLNLWDRTNRYEKAAGGKHPVNWAVDFRFFMLNGWNDEGTPGGTASSSTGYIGPTHAANGGLTRMPMVHLPLRPLRSLVELQHFHLRQHNACPPYMSEPIGNSHAHPLVAPDACFIPDESFLANGSLASDLHQYDDSYVANNLLFDDWFFSSIAPETRPFTAAEARSLNDVYRDHLSGEKSLPNGAYRPRQAVFAGQAANAAQMDLSPASDSWRTIASRLEVEGMFNVNSTSVAAWRSLLGHLSGSGVPYLSPDGTIVFESGGGHPVSRSPVSGEKEAGTVANTSGLFPEAGEFTGHRRLSDAQLDALAEAIVRQVKLRGPFLSLSEFVNRKLTASASEKDLARAGAIEAALLELADDIQGDLPLLATEITSADIPPEAEYRFPYAALGSSAYGFPGWVRQADVLRPLAPVLSVRDDSFVIRAYGNSREGSGRILAEAWVEAVIRRTADYVDPSDPPTDLPGASKQSLPSDRSLSTTNLLHGRRYEIVSFRWLQRDEV